MKSSHPILLLVLLLPACTLGPDYQRPEFLCVSDWKQGKAVASARVPDEWWRLYQDRILNRLVTEALAANPSLDAARARVEQSRSLVGLSRASLFPALNLTGGASTRRFAQDVMGSQLPAGFNVPLQRDAYQANLELGYELDLWGAHRRGREAAAAEAEAAQAMLAWQRLGLAGEVTRHHLLRQGLMRQQSLLGQILKARERSLAMLEERQRAGLIDRLQLNQARTDVELARNDLSAVERQLEAAGHALAVLCGKAPAGFDGGKLVAAQDMPELRPGLPSALLSRRPDLYAAEQRLRAANARIGVAEAAFYPDFNLLVSGGYESVNPANFLEWRNRIFSLGAGLSAPVFKGGANRAAWEKSVAVRDEELANYRTAWLEALKQVEDALVDLRQLSLACDALKQANAKSRASLDTLSERQQKGLADDLEVIEAEVSSLRIELLWIECEANQRISFAALAKALGGGWQVK